ncbi:MAG: response regulator [Limisphaerales bacterium]
MNHHMNSGVLIVDDDPLVLTSVQWTIARLGYKRIHTASCAAQARSLFLAHRFGVIIVDISLPDTDGRQLVPKP